MSVRMLFCWGVYLIIHEGQVKPQKNSQILYKFVMYEGESIKNQPNLFLGEINLFFFDVVAL